MILGLTGLPSSGKDTICERAGQFSKYPVERRSFADKLKRSAAALLGISLEQMEELKRVDDDCIDVLDRSNPNVYDPPLLACLTMRQFLQRYGTEAHREIFGETFWIDQCLPLPRVQSINDIHNNPYAENRLIIVTDVRFPNEAERVHMLGGKMVEVIGPGSEKSEHASDQHIGHQYINYKIVNTARDDDFKLLDGQLEILLAHLGLRAVKSNEAPTASVGT